MQRKDGIMCVDDMIVISLFYFGRPDIQTGYSNQKEEISVSVAILSNKINPSMGTEAHPRFLFKKRAF